MEDSQDLNSKLSELYQKLVTENMQLKSQMNSRKSSAIDKSQEDLNTKDKAFPKV